MILLFPMAVALICLLTIPICYAQTSNIRITPEYDVYVAELELDRNFEGRFRNHAGYVNGSIVSYIKFNLSSIPRPNLMNDIIIDSAELRLLVPATNTRNYDNFVNSSIVGILSSAYRLPLGSPRVIFFQATGKSAISQNSLMLFT
jgi:hypothetical protein